MVDTDELLNEAMNQLRQAREDLKKVYRERAHLVAALTAHYPAVWTDDLEDQWRIVYVTFPSGQASWHIAQADWDLFLHLPLVVDNPWDGHDTDEKYRRVRASVYTKG